MSQLTRKPAARRYRQVKRGVNAWVRVLVQQHEIAPPTFVHFVEFLELVYEVRIRLAYKPDGVWITIPRSDRTEVGVRVAAWLYGVDYILPRYHTRTSYDV